jgi:hypothetical protein
MTMADKNSLRAIGFGFGAITMLVVAAAAFVVADAQRSAAERAPLALLVAR